MEQRILLCLQDGIDFPIAFLGAIKAGVATAATVVLWNDRLTPLEWAGMGIIILSGIIAMRTERKELVEEGGEGLHGMNVI